MSPKSASVDMTQAFTEGVQALVASATPAQARRDLRLCEICLQWTADGHQCYRAGVCELQDNEVADLVQK